MAVDWSPAQSCVRVDLPTLRWPWAPLATDDANSKAACFHAVPAASGRLRCMVRGALLLPGCILPGGIVYFGVPETTF